MGLVVLAGAAGAAPVAVTTSPAGMTRGGQPYFVKGAGGQEKLDQLKAAGANSIRTWSTDGLDKTLETAAKHGLTVSAGIWLEPECNWFSYHKPEHCAKQAERVKADILRYREHPALLAWGLGNEAEGDGKNAAFWQQIGRLAMLAKSLDPAHPTFTAVAGISAEKAEGMNLHAPQLDYVGVNTYAGLFSLRKTLTDIKWTRPWLVTEWGPQGFWERPHGPGGMALEQTSTEKAGMMAKGYETVIAPGGACLGSYAFVWGWKNEGTVTWFGLLTDQGESTASVDVLHRAWQGNPPANTAPRIAPLTGAPTEPVSPRTAFTAATSASDAEGDALTWRWAVLPESSGNNNGVSPPMPPAVADSIAASNKPEVAVRAPGKPGRYRLHVWVSDGKGHAATANAPLVVK